MFGLETEKRADMIHEMLEQMDEIFSDLRLEYLDVAKKYDEAMERIIDHVKLNLGVTKVVGGWPSSEGLCSTLRFGRSVMK